MRALALGEGEGRNAVWLARQGLTVLAVDQSANGLAKARELAARAGAAIATACADLAEWQWPRGEYDLVLAIFLHVPPALRPRLHQSMLAALEPGGLLIMEAFHPNQLNYRSGGPQSLDMLYTAEMLRADFAGAEFLLLDEAVIELDEGRYHQGPGAVTRLVARRQDQA